MRSLMENKYIYIYILVLRGDHGALERNPTLKRINAIMNDSCGNLQRKVSVAHFGIRVLLVIFCFQKWKNF